MLCLIAPVCEYCWNLSIYQKIINRDEAHVSGLSVLFLLQQYTFSNPQILLLTYLHSKIIKKLTNCSAHHLPDQIEDQSSCVMSNGKIHSVRIMRWPACVACSTNRRPRTRCQSKHTLRKVCLMKIKRGGLMTWDTYSVLRFLSRLKEPGCKSLILLNLRSLLKH